MQLTLSQYLQMLNQEQGAMQKQASEEQQVQQPADLETQVMTKVASALEKRENLVLSPEEVAYLIGLGQAAIQKTAAEMAPADSETEEPMVVDADGDGVPDTLVADPEDIVQAIEELLQEGGIDPQQALQILQIVEQHLAQEEAMEKQASGVRLTEEQYKHLQKIDEALYGKRSPAKSSAKEAEKLGLRQRLSNLISSITGSVKSGASRAWNWSKENKKVAIPLAVLGGAGILGGAGYAGYRHYQNRQQQG